ncbi:MAG: peptidoglycan endopeptidase [Candidatus Andeanibacterium colombiense]|uniref:Peptidoglycan endopeptidase n=1 Tax=Candidatus Andeanibacterium colombiense TaxID=3121345 RepID=A0AAJ6BNQ8_9SPHN|nr:MAG: peptidoglycan endopeptidase [Sphingomonadaceae bacterium]
MSGAALAHAAEGLIGAPFRLHGRDPATGLDCVGLLVAALAAIGRHPPAPLAYGLRNRDIAGPLAFARGMGFAEVIGALLPGDVLLADAGPLQQHLLIAAPGGGLIHAHAGLRRVVATPGPLGWPLLRHWRLTD